MGARPAELEPIARKGYADKTFTQFYDSFLEEVGLTFAGVFSTAQPDAGTRPEPAPACAPGRALPRQA